MRSHEVDKVSSNLGSEVGPGVSQDNLGATMPADDLGHEKVGSCDGSHVTSSLGFDPFK